MVPALVETPRVKSPERALAVRFLECPVAAAISRAVSPLGC